MLAELDEMMIDKQAFYRDRWNVFDCLTLLCITAGWITRMANNDTLWGKALYAFAAPLMVTRVLFFLQYFPSQGVMIQVSEGQNKAAVGVGARYFPRGRNGGIWLSLGLLNCCRAH